MIHKVSGKKKELQEVHELPNNFILEESSAGLSITVVIMPCTVAPVTVAAPASEASSSSSTSSSASACQADTETITVQLLSGATCVHGSVLGLPVTSTLKTCKTNPCVLIGIKEDVPVPLKYDQLLNIVEAIYLKKEDEDVDWHAQDLYRLTANKGQSNDVHSKAAPVYMQVMQPVTTRFHMVHSGDLLVALVPKNLLDRDVLKSHGSAVESDRTRQLVLANRSNEIMMSLMTNTNVKRSFKYFTDVFVSSLSKSRSKISSAV